MLSYNDQKAKAKANSDRINSVNRDTSELSKLKKRAGTGGDQLTKNKQAHYLDEDTKKAQAWGREKSPAKKPSNETLQQYNEPKLKPKAKAQPAQVMSVTQQPMSDARTPQRKPYK